MAICSRKGGSGDLQEGSTKHLLLWVKCELWEQERFCSYCPQDLISEKCDQCERHLTKQRRINWSNCLQSSQYRRLVSKPWFSTQNNQRLDKVSVNSLFEPNDTTFSCCVPSSMNNFVTLLNSQSIRGLTGMKPKLTLISSAGRRKKQELRAETHWSLFLNHIASLRGNTVSSAGCTGIWKA